MTPTEWRDVISKHMGESTVGCWRCGALADVLCRILQLQGHRACLVWGITNGISHMWLECDGEIVDPTVEQFSDPPVYIEHERGPYDSDLACRPRD